MDSENINIHNEDYFTGIEIPTSIKQECCYFIKYIHPHGFKFQDVYNNCSNSTQLGLKSGGIRHCTGHYIERTLRNKAHTNSLRLRQVSTAEAHQVSSALKRLKEMYPWRFQDQATMPFSHDYIDHYDKDGDDNYYVLPATTRCSTSTTPKVRTSSVSDASLNSMLGNLTISPLGSAHRNSRGPDMLKLHTIIMTCIQPLPKLLKSMPSIQTTK